MPLSPLPIGMPPVPFRFLRRQLALFIRHPHEIRPVLIDGRGVISIIYHLVIVVREVVLKRLPRSPGPALPEILVFLLGIFASDSYPGWRVPRRFQLAFGQPFRRRWMLRGLVLAGSDETLARDVV